MSAVGMTKARRARPLAVGAVAALMVLGGLTLRALGHVAGASQSARGIQPGLGFGLGNSGSQWNPDVSQMPAGQETTLSQAEAQAGPPVYTPNVPLASDGSVSHVWVATVDPSDGMLPTYPRTAIGIAYSSGIQVMFVPNQYTPNAAPFSQAQAAASYQELAAEISSQTPGGMTTGTIQGIPVQIIPQDVQGQGNPGSVHFALGTSNLDSQGVTVLGRFGTADLEAVASSIIAQWQQANPGQ